MKDEIARLKKENAALEHEIRNYKKVIERNNTIISSKRMKAADSLAKYFNFFFPKNSLRRKIGLFPYRIVVWSVRGVRGLPAYIKLAPELKLLKSHLDNYVDCGRKLIIYETIPWESPLRQRPHHLAEKMAAAGLGVVYIDSFRLQEAYIKFASEGLVVVSNNRHIIKLIDRYTNLLDSYYMLPSAQPVALSRLDHFVKQKSCKLIYEYIDDFDEDISGDVTSLLMAFNSLEKYNPILLLASADKLYNQLSRRFDKKNIIFSKNAVNVDHFNFKTGRFGRRVPKDIANIKKIGKIAGYYGAMAPWLDYDLIGEAAKKLSKIQFVFIGPDYHDGLSLLPDLPNVHYLGGKNYSELPNYSYHFDCALIPFREGDIAKSTSPVKLFEYMAMGLPTVCTKDLLECDGYDNVLMSANHDDFIKNINKAISMKQIARVRNSLLNQASKNTWEARANDIKKFLDSRKEVK